MRWCIESSQCWTSHISNSERMVANSLYYHHYFFCTFISNSCLQNHSHMTMCMYTHTHTHTHTLITSLVRNSYFRHRVIKLYSLGLLVEENVGWWMTEELTTYWWLLCTRPFSLLHVGSIPGLGRSPRGGNSNHSNILAWEIPWTEEPGGLQSMGSQSQTGVRN